MAIIYAGTNGYLDAIPVSEVRQFETGLYRFIETRAPQVFTDIASKKQLDDDLKKALDAAVKEFTTQFAARKASAA